jgi:site-specific DNA-methyltransferase (adenine-specific)
MNINLYHTDCIDFMKEKPDNFYDLAIVDPPYGLGIKGDMIKRRTPKMSSKRRNTFGKSILSVKYEEKEWDVKPTKEYWLELFRVSKNQIVWGGNHFRLPLSTGWIFWDKLQQEEANFSHGELAWTSFNQRILKFTHQWAGFAKATPEDRIHPTQKPVALYEWLLKNYAKNGDKILDTHGGSGSICIACFNLGMDLDWCELDVDYFNLAKNRFEKFKQKNKNRLFETKLEEGIIKYNPNSKLF